MALDDTVITSNEKKRMSLDYDQPAVQLHDLVLFTKVYFSYLLTQAKYVQIIRSNST